MQQNKIAIVTGGGSGIGFGITKKFVGSGYQTVILGRSEKKLQEAQSELGDLCHPVSFDITDLKAIPNLVNEIAGKYGRIDILVNNAGINMKKNILEVTDEEFQKIIMTNLISLFALSREVAKKMVENKSGKIIHISSMTAHYGLPKVVAYSASKAAVEGLTRAMAVELSQLGIQVNSVAPGFIVTEMTDRAFQNDPGRKERVLARTPAGKMGTPEDIAEAVYFLTTKGADFITGEVIKVDGGNSIGF